MHSSYDIWKLLSGIAIFLLGMSFLEESIRRIAGRPFKLFLRKHTSSNLKAIAGSAVITAILQSSSVVNLLALAFVGAGVIQMQNALAVTLGANLGTTFSGWIIALIGFKIDIENIALAVTGISGTTMVLINKESRFHDGSKMLTGFAFLFVGLGYMKASVEDVMHQIDLAGMAQLPTIFFFITGFFITSVIQSSSATMAIVLSALHVNAIALLPAMAIVLGSEVGTGVKLVLVSIKGIPVKKQVAAGNVLFNIITALLILLFLFPVSQLITHTFAITNPLIALVFFQTFVNIIGIVIFFPFLPAMGRFLEKRFSGSETETLFIHKIDAADTDMAMEALEKESRNFIYHVSEFIHAAFDKQMALLNKLALNKEFITKTVMGKYKYIKQMHGEINAYCISLETHITDQPTTSRLEQLISALRNAMYAAKNIKDACPDIEQLRNSSNDIKYNFYQKAGDKVADFHHRLLDLILSGKAASSHELTGIYKSMQKEYAESLKELYREAAPKRVNETEFSTLLNFNREMYTSFKSIIFSVKDCLLDKAAATHFDELPGFIR